MTARRIDFGWVGISLLLSSIVSTGCEDRSQAAERRMQAVPVMVATVRKEDVPLEFRALGTVEASSTVDVVSQVTGVITEVHFREGDLVKKGDVLFSVDTRPYRASLAVAQAELDRSRALAEQARIEAERTERLVNGGLASPQDLDRARASAASTAASVKVGEATREGANLGVAFTRIASPLDGRTGSLLVHAGNVVHANDTQPLVVIRSLSPVQVRFAVPQEYLAKIRAHGPDVPLTVRVTSRGERDALEGPVSFLENTVDTATGTISLKATFSNQDQRLWPGTSVDVVLILEIEKGMLTAPVAAVQSGQDGAFAFVVRDGKSSLRRVEVLRATDRLVLIRSGLEFGERVVTDGQIRLRDGTPVTVKPSRAEDGPSDAGTASE